MLGTSLKISHYLLTKEHGDLNSKETTPNPWACCGAQRKKIFWQNEAQNLLDGRSLVFWWVPDGTTKYIQGLTKDRGEAPKREWVGSHLTPPLDEQLSKVKGNRIYVHVCPQIPYRMTSVYIKKKRGCRANGVSICCNHFIIVFRILPLSIQNFHPIPMVTFQLAASCCASGRLEFMGA